VLVRAYALSARAAGVPVSLYADMPYCVAHGWPSWVVGGDEEAGQDVDRYWRREIGRLPGLGDLRDATVVHLDAGAAAAKLRAMLCYGTQIEGLEASARGLLQEPEVHGYEVSWNLL
jgi:hypothetical protein